MSCLFFDEKWNGNLLFCESLGQIRFAIAAAELRRLSGIQRIFFEKSSKMSCSFSAISIHEICSPSSCCDAHGFHTSSTINRSNEHKFSLTIDHIMCLCERFLIWFFYALEAKMAENILALALLNGIAENTPVTVATAVANKASFFHGFLWQHLTM